MTWDDIIKLFLSMLVSVGGAGFLILSLSNWLGKIWAKRINDEYKASLDKEIEFYKSELERARNDYQRFASKKFMIIEETWMAMHRIVDEMPIYNPNNKNYLEYLSETINVITKYCKVINRNSLFFNDTIQELLNSYVSACSDVTYSASKRLNDSSMESGKIQEIMENTYKKSIEKEKILKKIKLEFKKELGFNESK